MARPIAIIILGISMPGVVFSEHRPLRGDGAGATVSDTNKLKECLSKLNSSSCASTFACEWCEIHGSSGLCMPSMYAEMAQCSKWEDMDTSCILSAVDGDDPQTRCEKAKDQEGGRCTWCHGFGAGICLDKVQVESAKHFLRCGEEELKGSVFTTG